MACRSRVELFGCVREILVLIPERWRAGPRQSLATPWWKTGRSVYPAFAYDLRWLHNSNAMVNQQAGTGKFSFSNQQASRHVPQGRKSESTEDLIPTTANRNGGPSRRRTGRRGSILALREGCDCVQAIQTATYSLSEAGCRPKKLRARRWR